MNLYIQLSNVKDEINNLKYDLKFEIADYNYYKSETKWINNIMIKSNEHRLELLKNTIEKIKYIKSQIKLLESS